MANSDVFSDDFVQSKLSNAEIITPGVFITDLMMD